MSKQGKAWRAVTLLDERRLTAGLVNHRWPCWSLDGKWLAFAADDCWVIVDRRGRVARVLPGPAEGGACFGGGDSFAFARRGGGTSEIWMTSGGGTPAVRLLGGDGGLYREPIFSPEGNRLVVAWSGDGSGRTRLLSLEVATGARQPLTQDPARIDRCPAFSPDGTMLFFEGAIGGDVAIYALDLQKSETHRATPHNFVYRRPAPLASDLFVAERQEANGPARLVLVDWQKERERPLVDGEGEERDPAAIRSTSGKLRVAWSSLPPQNGKPRRSDIVIARLKGLAALVAEHQTESLPPPPAPSTPDDPLPPVEVR